LELGTKFQTETPVIFEDTQTPFQNDVQQAVGSLCVPTKNNVI